MKRKIRNLRLLVIFAIWMAIISIISLKAIEVGTEIKPLPLPVINQMELSSPDSFEIEIA